MFHLLRPIYDVNVFSLLRRDLDAVPATHSCAQQKPWCCRCAKCLYVWMNYVAWLPPETVAATFDVNLFDLAENRTILRKMLGLESYKPTDCVGTVSEARLAFAMCRAKASAVSSPTTSTSPSSSPRPNHPRSLRDGDQPSRTDLPVPSRRADRFPVPRQRRPGQSLRVDVLSKCDDGLPPPRASTCRARAVGEGQTLRARRRSWTEDWPAQRGEPSRRTRSIPFLPR